MIWPCFPNGFSVHSVYFGLSRAAKQTEVILRTHFQRMILGRRRILRILLIGWLNHHVQEGATAKWAKVDNLTVPFLLFGWFPSPRTVLELFEPVRCVLAACLHSSYRMAEPQGVNWWVTADFARFSILLYKVSADLIWLRTAWKHYFLPDFFQLVIRTPTNIFRGFLVLLRYLRKVNIFNICFRK